MCKENLDKTESNKRIPLENVKKLIPKIPVLLAIVIVASVVIKLEKNIEIISTTALIEADTTEKINYITDMFHIKNTDNIGSYSVFFKEGCMMAIMKDVKNIHELCFENLAYYEITEKDYNEIVRTEEEFNEILNTPIDERKPDYYESPERKFEGKWYSSWISTSNNYWKMTFRDKDNNYGIFLHKTDEGLCCRIRVGWDLEHLEKLRSMD